VTHDKFKIFAIGRGGEPITSVKAMANEKEIVIWEYT
jgi:hypothetical protein